MQCSRRQGRTRFRDEIDSRFSFTAQEIGAFISSAGGKDHDIDYEKAHAAWEAERGNFQARLSLHDELPGHLVHGRLARDHQGMASTRIMNGAFNA